MNHIRARILGFVLAACLAGSALAQGPDYSTLYGKHVAGYQGWFGCPADGVGWFHWFRDNRPDAKNLVVDMLPDISWAKPTDRCDTGLLNQDGQKIYLFSSRNVDIVHEHFRWMREYDLDGVALQRFVSALRGSQGKFTDAVLNNVRAAAEAEGRGFFIMYDLSGNNPDMVTSVTEDWIKLQKSGLLNSPSYMHHRGKPLVGLWGAGINDRSITISQINQLIAFFQKPEYAATTIGGVPMYWRTLGRDSQKDPAWSAVFRSYDVISPWSVGRLKNREEIAKFIDGDLVQDMKEAEHFGKDYMPVQYPGMSFYNAQKGRVPLNNVPRRCGEFFKAYGNGLLRRDSRMVYTAMFDEVNEGTAIFKVNTSKQNSPPQANLATLSDGSCSASSDMYLSIAGDLTRRLHKRHAR